MKKILIVAIVLLCVACSQQERPQRGTMKPLTKDSADNDMDLTGKWVWEKNSKEAKFSVFILKDNNSYIGNYCAVALSGAKIDCNVYDDFPSFKIEKAQGNEFIVVFKTYFSEVTGKVKIRIEGNKMYWQVVEQPKGEYYCPDVAVLKRTDKEKVLRDSLK
jgi:hypothetical protein